MRIFRENTTLKILAVVVAVVLWAFVKATQGVGSERMQLTLKVPLEVEGRGKDIEVDAPSFVSVTLRGDKRDLENMPTENFIRARVDVTGLGPGLYPRNVRVVPPGGLELVEVDPQQVTLSISSRVIRNKPVAIVLSGSPARGMVTGTPATDPASVQVSGPESSVEQVDRVEGEVVLNQEQMSFTVAVRDLKPVDSGGRLVHRVRVERNSVLATVPVNNVSTPVTVPVGADNIRFRQKPGFAYDVRVYPQNVTLLVGPNGKAPGLIKTEVVDLGDVSHTVTRPGVQLLTEGLSLVSEPQVTVEVVARRVPAPAPTQSQTASPLRPSPSPNT